MVHVLGRLCERCCAAVGESGADVVDLLRSVSPLYDRAMKKPRFEAKPIGSGALYVVWDNERDLEASAPMTKKDATATAQSFNAESERLSAAD